MKAIYQKPETKIILVQSQSLLQTASKTPKGEGYNGEEVLSRRNSSSFNVWGDDEDEE